MDDAPVDPLTGSPTITHQAIASPVAPPAPPLTVSPPVGLTHLITNVPPSITPSTA